MRGVDLQHINRMQHVANTKNNNIRILDVDASVLLSSMHPLLSHVPSPRVTLTSSRFLVPDWSPLSPLSDSTRVVTTP